MRSIQIIFVTVCLLTTAVQLHAAEATVTQVKFWAGASGRNDYDTSLLRLALDATRPTHGDYQFVLVERSFGVNRGRRLLAEGDIINTYASPERPDIVRERENIIHVPFPILRGLLGYRRLLIHQHDIARFSKIDSLIALAKLTAGQGRDWIDADILQHNGLRVTDSAIYRQLFEMLDRKRFDYVPLGAHEIDNALQAHKPFNSNLTIEPRLLLYYPFPVVFQVSKRYPELAERILLGLQIVEQNGQFEQLFNRHFSALLSSLRKQDNKLLVLQNPYVEKGSPLTQPRLSGAAIDW